MKRVAMLTVWSVGLLIGCGGAQGPASSEPVGDTHAEAPDEQEAAGDTGTDGQDRAEGQGEAAVAAPAAPVTFQLVNLAKEDLVFSIDKGWQPVIFAFSGKPPKAKSIMMFPKACTTACDAAAEELCPVCTEPEDAKEVQASEQRKVVAPGASLDVPWDAQVFVYEKTRANGRRCDCYRTEPVPPETYTVRACGLRITKTASKASKYQCVDTSMTLPADGPQVIKLEFPAP